PCGSIASGPCASSSTTSGTAPASSTTSACAVRCPARSARATRELPCGWVASSHRCGSRCVAKVWDVYLDGDDAAVLLRAAATLERHRWAREPLPFDDVARLLARFRKIVPLAEEDAR